VRDKEAAAAAYKRYIELSDGRLSDGRNVRILGRIARATARTQPAGAIRMLAAAALLAPRPTLVRVHLPALRHLIPAEELDALLEREDLDGGGRRALTQLRAEMYAPEPDRRYLEILRQHLAMIQDLARRHGVETVISSYPSSRAAPRETYRTAAGQGGSLYAPVAERFERELLLRPREELFVPDGHCSDAGYELVARTVAEVIAGSLSSAGQPARNDYAPAQASATAPAARRPDSSAPLQDGSIR
jgi:hypothetical protein